MNQQYKKLSSIYDIFILLMSIYVVVLMAIQIIHKFPSNVSILLDQIDFFICLIFLIDWSYFLYKSSSKKQYLKTRWIDLLASIPFAQVLRPFRIFRIARIFRALRIARGAKGGILILRKITANRMLSALLIYIICTIFIFFYCALGIFNFEHNINPRIANFGDSVWCSFTTLSSVGYGDIYPITTGGRIMAGILVLTGMGLFSMVTAEFASVFLNYLRNNQNNE